MLLNRAVDDAAVCAGATTKAETGLSTAAAAKTVNETDFILRGVCGE